jgi:hypothetical protein
MVALTWLAADPATHAWLHQHETQGKSTSCPSHRCGHHHDDERPASSESPERDDCVIAKFALGQIDATAAPQFALAPAEHVFVFLAPALSAVFSPVAHRLPPGCGPPTV